jgi:hypothetical protein
MDDHINGLTELDENILTFDVPDDALERAQRQFLMDKPRTRSDIALTGIIAIGRCNARHDEGIVVRHALYFPLPAALVLPHCCSPLRGRPT